MGDGSFFSGNFLIDPGFPFFYIPETYFKKIVKHQNYEAQEYSLEDCIDKCIDYMRDHGLFFVTTPEERREAAILFLNAEE